METFKYKKISPYPYVVRDISLYVPENINENEIIRVIKKEEGKNLCNLSDPRLIDSFIKKCLMELPKNHLALE